METDRAGVTVRSSDAVRHGSGYRALQSFGLEVTSGPARGSVDFFAHGFMTNSRGMTAQLLHSIAVHVAPDVPVIDAAPSVGVGEFARPSLDRITQFRAVGKTMRLSSHPLRWEAH